MKCKECKGRIVDIDGELSCVECGIVHSMTFESPKLKITKPKKSYTHSHGDLENDTEFGLGSVIGPENFKGASRLRRLASRQDGEDRKMKKAMFFINIVKSEFGLPNSAKRDMKDYYSALSTKGVFTSRMSYEERAASIGYITIKEYGFGYTLKEICTILDVTMKKVGRNARLYARHLGKSHVFTMSNPQGMIEKYCTKFTDNRKFMNDILNMYHYLDSIVSNHPSTQYLAGITYFVEKLKHSKEYSKIQIADAFETNPRRITEVVKRIKDTLNIKDTFGLTVEDIMEGIR